MQPGNRIQHVSPLFVLPRHTLGGMLNGIFRGLINSWMSLLFFFILPP